MKNRSLAWRREGSCSIAERGNLRLQILHSNFGDFAPYAYDVKGPFDICGEVRIPVTIRGWWPFKKTLQEAVAVCEEAAASAEVQLAALVVRGRNFNVRVQGALNER